MSFVKLRHYSQVLFNVLFFRHKFSYLHLNSQHTGLSSQSEDVVVTKPKVSTDWAKSIFVLLPVTFERCYADFASLDKSPSATICLHVTEDLKSMVNICLNTYGKVTIICQNKTQDLQ